VLIAADMPAHAGRRQHFGLALLCGIGFTTSIVIALLAFPDAPLLQTKAKPGVLLGSLLSESPAMRCGGWRGARAMPGRRKTAAPSEGQGCAMPRPATFS
jgi:NhaA family Na+:H+ antiporter